MNKTEKGLSLKEHILKEVENIHKPAAKYPAVVKLGCGDVNDRWC